MSEIIENARREKQDVLKGIIRELHAGVPVEKLRKTFAALIKNTSPEEIARHGERPHSRGIPVEEVQRLCDVHAQVFDKALKKAGNRAASPVIPFTRMSRKTWRPPPAQRAQAGGQAVGQGTSG